MGLAPERGVVVCRRGVSASGVRRAPATAAPSGCVGNFQNADGASAALFMTLNIPVWSPSGARQTRAWLEGVVRSRVSDEVGRGGLRAQVLQGPPRMRARTQCCLKSRM